MDLSESRLPRVVMVVRLFYPWVGGTERQAHKLSLELMRRGVDLQLVTGWWFRGTPQTETIDGVPVYRNHTLWEFFGIKGLRKFGGYLYIITLIWHLWRRRSTFDIIHVHGLNYHTFAAVLAGRLTGRPVLVKLANSGPASDILKMRRGQQLALSKWMLPTALKSQRFVALNNAIVSELREAGVPEDAIVEIPNGVEMKSASAEPGLHDPARLVYVGRLHPQKGVDAAIRAVALVRSESRAPAVNFRLVGDGPDRRGLEQLVDQLGVSDSVQFLGIRDDVSAKLEESDVFVLTSRAEGLSNALLEAMAAGLPVIVSNVPGNNDVVVDGENGILVDPEDPEDIAAALTRVLGDGAIRSRLGHEGRRTVGQRYALAQTADQYISLYQELAASSQLSSTPSVRRESPSL